MKTGHAAHAPEVMILLQAIIYFLICLAATTAGGISGVGGGVIIKPVLDAVSGMDAATASFLSGCTVLAMTATSMLRSRGGPVRVEKRRGTLLAMGAAAGGVLGKEIFELVRSAGGVTVDIVQQAMMILLTAGVFVYTLNRQKVKTKDVKNAAACVAIGLTLGLLSAFLGIGGGPVNLAVLYYFFSMDSKTAALNSLYVILFSQAASFINTLARGTVPEFDWPVLIAMCAGGVLGGFLGRGISAKLTNRDVDRLFLVIMAVITLISCYSLVRCFV